MNPDIWPRAVAFAYDLASNGAEVDGYVSWMHGENHMSARGRMAAFTETSPAGGPVTIGIRGALSRPTAAAPAAFQSIHLEIRKAGADNATAEVSLPSTGQLRTLDDPMGVGPIMGSSMSWIVQNWGNERPSEYINIWLANVWAERRLYRPPVSVVDIVKAFLSRARRYRDPGER